MVSGEASHVSPDVRAGSKKSNDAQNEKRDIMFLLMLVLQLESMRISVGYVRRRIGIEIKYSAVKIPTRNRKRMPLIPDIFAGNKTAAK